VRTVVTAAVRPVVALPAVGAFDLAVVRTTLGRLGLPALAGVLAVLRRPGLLDELSGSRCGLNAPGRLSAADGVVVRAIPTIAPVSSVSVAVGRVRPG